MQVDFKFLLRDFKSKELNLLSLTLFLFMFCVSTALMFTNGLQQGLGGTASILLGGDRLLSSPTPIQANIIQKANDFNLETAQTLTFLSMLVHGNDLALAEVKAVDKHYPLKGVLKGSDALFAPEVSLLGIPAIGTVWLEQSLFTLLNLNINDVIMLGEATFQVTKVLTSEPDRGGEGLLLAPRALINAQDVAKTKLIQIGSRQSYNLLLSGTSKNLAAFDQWVTGQLNPNQSIKSSPQSRSSLKNLYQQGEDYIRIILIINFIIAGMSLSQVVKQFYQRQIKTVALLRCFGASFNWILLRYILKFFKQAVIAGMLGFMLGVALIYLVHGYFETIFRQKIVLSIGWPFLIAWTLLLLLMCIFVVLPLYGLKQIPVFAILRPNAALKSLKSTSPKKSNTISELLKRRWLIILNHTGPSFRFGINSLFHNFWDNCLQLLAFTLIFACAWLIILLRNDLLDTWRREVPKDAPNYFVINIGPEETSQFTKLLQEKGVKSHGLYPIVRGRLIAVNNEMVATDEISSSKRRINRLLNLTYSLNFPQDNKIIAGVAFKVQNNAQNIAKPLVSVEEGFATRLSIRVGDKLRFQLGEKIIEAEVESIRRVEWDSFNPNFYVIFSPGSIDNFPTTYMTSFYIPPTHLSLLKNIISYFPNVSLIDISALIKQLIVTIHALSTIVEYLLLMTGLMTVLLFLCAIYANLDERRRNTLLLRTLGLDNLRLNIILLTEFLLLGGFAGLLSMLLANVVYAWLVKDLFHLQYHFNIYLAILGPLLAILLISCFAWLGIREILRVPPKEILARSA